MKKQQQEEHKQKLLEEKEGQIKEEEQIENKLEEYLISQELDDEKAQELRLKDVEAKPIVSTLNIPCPLIGVHLPLNEISIMTLGK